MLAPDLKSELVTIVENGEKNILVDLSICTFCDPSGMSALLLGKRICDGVNGNFILYGLTPGIVKMMDLIGFESLMKIAANREGAEALLV